MDRGRRGLPRGLLPHPRLHAEAQAAQHARAAEPGTRRRPHVGREVKVGLNGFIIARDTEREAREALKEIIEKANKPAVEGFRASLIGTPEQIAERIVAYRKRGVDLILGGFLHFQEEIEYFGANVLPLVWEIEQSEEDSRDQQVLVAI